MIDPVALPEGTVTFLFTDLEGSARPLQVHPDAYRDAVRRHHALLREAVEAHGGVVFEKVGDAVYAAFAQATDAVAAALAGQLALRREDWGAVGELRARMGVHSGEAERQEAHYFGAPLYRCARLMAAAHAGQIVLSGATAELVRDALPEGETLRDLGEHRLKDLVRPERVFQLGAPSLPADFPALRVADERPTNLPAQRNAFVGRPRAPRAARARRGLGPGPGGVARGRGRGGARRRAPPTRGPGRGPPAAGEPISAREQEVAALVARGLTNRQIADRLVISVRTVDRHVENLLRKLDLASRAQVAVWAVERRLAVGSRDG
jgi:class 3 adenylate cyclase/DNA-binding CsgD family transcriptional regulator